MSGPTWNGPAVGVMRPGFLAVSGCRPPKADASSREWDVYAAITNDVEFVMLGAEAERLIIVHGGAAGVDAIAHASAVGSARAEVFRPSWAPRSLSDAERKAWNRVAPMIRNAYVTTTERAIFWPAPWSRGTWDAVEKRLKTCGSQGFELRLVGWGKGGDRVPESIKRVLGKVGATWTEVSV